MSKSTRTTATALALLLTASSCGTLLYGERQGQNTDGLKVDPTVVAMDAGLLLFFIVPGVIGFVVDYSTGAIYLPAGEDAPQTPEILEED